MSASRFFNGVIKYSFYLLFFLVPLILTPWNYELFEFNKMVFVYTLTVIIVGAWMGRWIAQRKITIQRTPFDVPILLFLASQILSTIFSIDRHTSLWGYYSRFHGGLISTICYILLYYAFVNNMVKMQNAKLKNELSTFNCLYLLLVSATLITLYGIAEHFGIDANYWVQDVRNRVFSTLGQPNWLGAWIDALIFIPVVLILKGQFSVFRHSEVRLVGPKNLAKRSFHSLDPSLTLRMTEVILFMIFYFCLLFTGSRSAYIGFLSALAFFIFLMLLTKQLFVFKKKLGLILTGIIFISLLAGTPFTPSVFKLLSRPAPLSGTPTPFSGIREVPLLISSSEEIRKVVWSGALKIWQRWPVFGSGVETFAYSYYNFRPRQHNDLSEWDFLYNKAHNEYLNYLATTGSVGLGTYLLMTGWVLIWSIKKISNSKFLISKQIPNPKSKNFNKLDIGNYLGQLEIRSIRNLILHFALISGYVSILVTNFFGFSVVPVALLFWLFPAFLLGLMGNDKKVFAYDFTKHQPFSNLTMKQWNNLQKLLLIILFVSILYTLYSILLRVWWADVIFNRGRKLTQNGYLVQGQEELANAVSLNSHEPLFWSQLAENSAMLAFAYSQKEASSSADLVKQLAEVADLQAQKTLSMNPYHVNNYKSAVKVYLYMSSIDPSYRQKAIVTLKYAAGLAPTDPKLTYNLGQIYQETNDKEKARDYFKQTVKLKPNYLVAHLALAKLYHELGKIDKALTELKFILDNLDPSNEETLYWLKEWQEE